MGSQVRLPAGGKETHKALMQESLRRELPAGQVFDSIVEEWCILHWPRLQFALIDTFPGKASW